MLKGEKFLFDICSYYKIPIKKEKKGYTIDGRKYRGFRDALLSQYDRIIEDTINKKKNWRNEICYIDSKSHLYD